MRENDMNMDFFVIHKSNSFIHPPGSAISFYSFHPLTLCVCVCVCGLKPYLCF